MYNIMVATSQASKRVRLEANRNTGGGNTKSGLLSSTGRVNPLLNFTKRRTAVERPKVAAAASTSTASTSTASTSTVQQTP